MEAVARATGGSVFSAGGVDCVHQPPPHGELLVPFPDRAPGEAVVARARELGVRRVGVWLASASPAVEEALPVLGFGPGWQPHWMSAPAARAPADPRVSEPREVPEYDDYGRALLALVGPTTFLFVAREEGRFAGHAWLHVAAGVGGIYDVFVPEDLRRRGIGSALSLAASAKAAELGVETITLNAEFTPLYESLGYGSLGHGRTWWRHIA
jgi:GNAT superfamily N-acetyltransferase